MTGIKKKIFKLKWDGDGRGQKKYFNVENKEKKIAMNLKKKSAYAFYQGVIIIHQHSQLCDVMMKKLAEKPFIVFHFKND